MTKLWVNNEEHDFVERQEIEGMVRQILEMERQTILVEVANKALTQIVELQEQNDKLKDEIIATKVAALPKKREGFFKEFKGVLKKSFSDKEKK